MSKNPALDLSREGRQRRSEAVDARMSASNLTGEARTSARRQIEADVEREEVAAAATATNKADAGAECSRIAAIVKAGRDRDRAQQALRLAILGPISVSQAEGILPSLARDVDTTGADKAVPGFQPFPGESAATANERRRIGSIFAHPSATDRFKSACALALEGDAIPAEAVASLLAALPPEQPQAGGWRLRLRMQV